MNSLPTIIFFLLAHIFYSESARILAFFPLRAPSHQFVYQGVIEELGRRGHEVVYVTGYPYKEPPTGIQQIYIPINPLYEEFDVVTFGELKLPQMEQVFFDFGKVMADLFLKDPVVQELIHSDQKFDAVMFESYFFQEYYSALIHKFNAVAIEIMPSGNNAWLNELSGLPDNPSYQLDYKSELSNSMNFWQRLYNTYVTTGTVLFCNYYLRTVMQSAMDQYFNYTGWEGRPPLDVLAKNRSLILVNSHQSLTYPFPTAPHVKLIGGINIKPNKPLPEELQTFLDEGKEGVIYMSFGSTMNLSSVANKHILDSFMSVFEKLPQRVVMKFESQYPGTPPSNVKVSKWLPQQDILAHKNCVLFITHGGFLSLTEAVYYGVPLVGTPFYADQANNLIFAETKGFGKLLRYRNISKDSVSWTIREVLTNPSFKAEILRRSKMFRDMRHTPAEEAAYWIEHSIKYPYSLTPKSVDLSTVQLHMIDIKVFVIAVVFSILFALFYVTRFIINFVIKSKAKEKLKNQ